MTEKEQELSMGKKKDKSKMLVAKHERKRLVGVWGEGKETMLKYILAKGVFRMYIKLI